MTAAQALEGAVELVPFVITLPMPPMLTNSGAGRSRNYWVIHREQQTYKALLDALQSARQIPPPPTVPFGKVLVSSVMYLGGRMDMDNAMARHKWPLDWLATRGYLVNDRLVEWEGLPRQVIGRKHVYRIALTFTPIVSQVTR